MNKTGLPRYREHIQRTVKNSLPSLEYVYADTGATYAASVLWPPYDLSYPSHKCWDETHKGPPFKTGGPVDIIHRDCSQFPLIKRLDLTRNVGYPSRPVTYKHYFRPGVTDLITDPIGVDDRSWDDPTPYGATGWKRFKPGKPAANLAQFIAELREFPKLFKFRLSNFRDLGSNYLNIQFGWKPFLNDIYDFLDMSNRLKKRLDFLRRNNGEWRKRGGTVLEETSYDVQTITTWPVTPTIPTGFWPNWVVSFNATKAVREYRKVWFEAKMRFFIPNIDTPEWLEKETYRMWGLSISPALVYELTPWSWLLDYFGNLGDMINNLSADQSTENLVALYAYIMGNSIISHEYEISCDLNKVYGDQNSRFKFSLNYETYWECKRRREASPFGFGFTFDALSDGQTAILAALGISRWPKLR